MRLANMILRILQWPREFVAGCCFLFVHSLFERRYFSVSDFELLLYVGQRAYSIDRLDGGCKGDGKAGGGNRPREGVRHSC